ncbi:MAG: hypothetical protein N4A45_10545 [Flavobacteriales bacterium]|jgi:hypothetical protein|nr:hypothetical protein [Flavobacteriales bacterium]
MAKNKEWSEVEINYLRENYGETPFSELKKEFDRSDNSIRLKAKELGLTKRKNQAWTKEELEFLKSDMPISEIARRTGRTYSAVNKKRNLIKKRTKLENSKNLDKYFDFSHIDDDIPILDRSSKSSQHLALLSNLAIGQSYQYPTDEHPTVRNQINSFPSGKFITKKWSDNTRRVWRVK